MARISVIDLFAGPGGLGEGFASLSRPSGRRCFRIRLSIEKDRFAHQTLTLRSFFRQFDSASVPDDYYGYLQGLLTREELFERFGKQARAATHEAWHAELGAETPGYAAVDRRIRKALGTGQKPWVLVGGPPCQAYSLAGRSRRLGAAGRATTEDEARRQKAEFYSDRRHTLYREYLRILAVHAPDVFVMENVRGILSSTLDGERIIGRILSDLRDPAAVLEPNGGFAVDERARYRLFAAADGDTLFDGEDLDPVDFLVQCEKYGVPQSRHRVLIMGVRADVADARGPLHIRLKPKPQTPVEDVLDDLPAVRGGLSRRYGVEDSGTAWRENLEKAVNATWFNRLDADLRETIRQAVAGLDDTLTVGRARFTRWEEQRIEYRPGWYHDERLQGVCNHQSRSHMPEDFLRYLFASAFAQVHRRSPQIGDFPEELLPDHRSAKEKNADGKEAFSDRFRVQVKGRPSTTVVSHISKDGHYYIHYDPSQCRSLTVREAARLQTFPDNYFFEGPRTSQYEQVGNAVPPLIASQIARSIYNYLSN